MPALRTKRNFDDDVFGDEFDTKSMKSIRVPATMCNLSKGLETFIQVGWFIVKFANNLGLLAFQWATIVILGGFSADLHGPKSINSVFFTDSLGAHFWFATGISFLEILSVFMRKNISDYKVRWNVIEPRKLIYKGRTLYFANAVLLMGTIFSVMKRVDCYWAPVVLDIENAGRYVYSWAFLIMLVFLVQKPVLIFVQGISRPIIPMWYRVIPISLFMLSQTAIFIMDISLGKGSLLFEDIFVRWEPPMAVSISFSLLYALTHFKLFKTLLAAKLMRFLLAGTTLFALLHFGVNFNFIMMSASAVLGNFQFMIAVAKLNVSGLAFRSLIENETMSKDNNNHLIPALKILYLLVLVEALLHIAACILEPVSWFIRRSMALSYGLADELGIKCITVYYHQAFDMCAGVDNKTMSKNCGDKRTMSIEQFSIEFIQCSGRGFSRMKRLAALRILHSLLQQNPPNSELWLEVATSTTVCGTLFNILGFTSPEDSDIRLLAAKIIKLVSMSIRIDSTREVNLVCLLLHAQDQPGSSSLVQMNKQTNSLVDLEGRCASNWRVGNIWQHIIEVLSIPHNRIIKDEDTLPLLGLQIFQGLSCDMDNCKVIGEAKELLPKIIKLISDTTNSQQKLLVTYSLMLLQTFAGLHEKIGASFRQELSTNIFLLSKLEYIFENSFSGEQLKPAIDIIYYLAMDVTNRDEIWRMQVVIIKLIEKFVSRDHLLGMAAGKALAMLAFECPSNSSAIFELVKRVQMLIELLGDDAFGVPSANILASLCANCKDLLVQQGQDWEVLCAMPQVMASILDDGPAERMIAMAGLASQICNAFSANPSVSLQLAKKLVHELDKKPCSESPNKRRVLVGLTISLIELCPSNAFFFKELGMLEVLSKVEKTFCRMEKYRLFLGSEGVVFEQGKPLSELVAIAKRKIEC